MLQVLAVAYVAVIGAAVVWVLSRRAIELVSGRLRVRAASAWNPPSDPAAVVTLVHGTWAKSATWVLPDSPLCTTLNAEWAGRLALFPFHWSGRNSVRARARAATALSAHCDVVAAKYPRASHYILAHSHAGNVALYALRQRPDLRVRGVACLSTPFLHVRTRNLGQVSRSGILAGLFISILVATVTLLQTLHWGEDAALLAGLCAAAAVTVSFHIASKRLHGPTLAACALPDSIGADLLIIRAAGDEASSALAAAHFGSWLAKRLWNYPASLLGDAYDSVARWRSGAVSILKWLSIPVVLSFGARLSMEPATIDSCRPFAYALQVAAGAGFLVLLWSVAVWWVSSAGGTLYHYLLSLAIAGFITGPLAIVLAVLILPFGIELAVSCTYLELTAEPVPPGTHTVHHLRANGLASTLALDHSRSYNDVSAIQLIAQWMRRVESVRGPAG